MINQFEHFLKQKEMADNTLNNYKLHVKGFLKWFDETKGTEFKILHRENIRDYICYLKNIKKSTAKTINAKISGLIKFNEYLIDTGFQNDLVISKKDNIKMQQQYASLAKMELKDIEKLRQLLLDNEKSKRNHCIVTVLAYAGLRISEALGIKMSDFNLVSRELLIRGKGNKSRTVFLNDKVVTSIREWLKERGTVESEYLFVSNRGQKLNRTVINKMFNTYSKKLGKEVTPHDLRHFFCSYALYKGLSIHEVANQAGHSNIHTTMIYTNPTKLEIMNKMNML